MLTRSQHECVMTYEYTQTVLIDNHNGLEISHCSHSTNVVDLRCEFSTNLLILRNGGSTEMVHFHKTITSTAKIMNCEFHNRQPLNPGPAPGNPRRWCIRWEWTKRQRNEAEMLSTGDNTGQINGAITHHHGITTCQHSIDNDSYINVTCMGLLGQSRVTGYSRADQL